MQDPSRTGRDEVRDVVEQPAHRAVGPTGDALAEFEPTAALERAELDPVGDASCFNGDAVERARGSRYVRNVVVVTLGTADASHAAQLTMGL